MGSIVTAEELHAAIIQGMPAEKSATPQDKEAERRNIAVGLASKMVLEGRLQPWELFDYAHGLLQFLNSGTPFRFDKGVLEK